MNRKEKISYIQRCITDKKINHNYIYSNEQNSYRYNKIKKGCYRFT